MRLLNRQQFGLAPDLWRRLNADTADALRIRRLLTASVAARALVSIIGPRGTGKTHALGQALARQPGVQVVTPLRLARDKLHIGDIETAVIRDLSDVTPRRAAEMRSRQVRQVLGEACRHGETVLVIDDAHLLHHQTLRALKRLRELAWLRVCPLLTVILVGQQSRTDHIPEVGLRSDTLTLAGLSAPEARQVLGEALGEQLEPTAADTLSAAARARNWLDLQALADECIAVALARGERRITPATVAAVLTPAAAVRPATRPGTRDQGGGDVSGYLARRGAARAATGG